MSGSVKRVGPAERGLPRPPVSAFSKVVSKVSTARPSASYDGFSVRWANVASVNPLAIKFPDADGPAAGSPLCLCDPNGLRVGQKVLVGSYGRTNVVLGGARAGSEAPSTPAVGPWKPLTLSSGWSQYGTAASWGAPEYRIANGRVELSGMVTGTLGKDTPVATLPPEAAPTRNRIVTGIENYTPVSVQITTGGVLYGNPVRSTPWLSLSSLSYPL